MAQTQQSPTQPLPTGPAAAAMPQVGPNGDPVDSSDPIIAQVQDALRAKIPPQYRVAVQQIVLAGMKVMFSAQTHHLMLNSIAGDTDPAHAVGMGVTQLITLLYRESKGTMPIPAIAPAAILLCCEALDFMEKSGIVKVTPAIMDSTTQVVIGYLMQKVGLTPQKMSQIAQQAAQGHPGVAPIAPQQQQQQQPAAPAAPQPAPAPSPAPAQPQGLVTQQMGA